MDLNQIPEDKIKISDRGNVIVEKPNNKDYDKIEIVCSNNLSSNKSTNTNNADLIDISTSNGTKSNLTNHKVDSNDIKVSTLFQWKEDGTNVYISGSFSNWGQWFLLTKNSITGVFELVLDLPTGVYEYKFIVDNEWKVSKHDPICKDEKGIINNTISIQPKYSAREESSNQEKSTKNPMEELKKELADIYTEYYPSKTELNLDAPNIPINYAYPYLLEHDKNQRQIGNYKYLEEENWNYYTENNSSKSIFISPHVNINHLNTKCFSNNIHNLVTSSVKRLRNKLVTFIYYKPFN